MRRNATGILFIPMPTNLPATVQHRRQRHLPNTWPPIPPTYLPACLLMMRSSTNNNTGRGIDKEERSPIERERDGSSS
ncbi:hypothetical protein Trydic_g12536 [Trypoxylus dichotomus]